MKSSLLRLLCGHGSLRAAAWTLAALLGSAGCGSPAQTRAASDAPERLAVEWRDGAVCYEIFVRSFQDSDGDGIGDLRGLTQRLDYINDGDPSTTRDLGARCVWLMPIAESPSYHGYDVADYYAVDRELGTNEDFKVFVTEAHRRGIAVLVDMVLNHASSEHPFFQDALNGPSAPHRSWFRWSPTKPDGKGPWGQEVWHRAPRGDGWYYGVFWHGMPDLNYDTPAVREEAKKVATYWLQDMGVDGFRLDAVPYLVEEGSRQLGTAGTHAFLREYAAHLRRVAPKAFTVGEVWDGIDRMLPYYPDQLESYFAFDLSDGLLDAVRTGSAKALLERYMRFEREVPDQRYSTFLRNHDQTRTLTALGGDVRRVKLAATLHLTLPGLPFVYYGEEIGMTGDKPDENLRTPMQWSAGAGEGTGFTTGTSWEPSRPDWRDRNVESQDADSSSLLSLYRRLIRLRGAHASLGSGDLVPLQSDRAGTAAYLRRGAAGAAPVLVVANLSSAPAPGARVTSKGAALPAGRYNVRNLLDGRTGEVLIVGGGGALQRYRPFERLDAMEAVVLELSRVE